ncbi:MAG: hypothetical protein L6R35_007243, partial [Caloplaca aegaea]
MSNPPANHQPNRILVNRYLPTSNQWANHEVNRNQLQHNRHHDNFPPTSPSPRDQIQYLHISSPSRPHQGHEQLYH